MTSERLFTASNTPNGIAYDGTSYWFADGSSSLFQYSPTGALLDVVTAPEGTPKGLVWAGGSFYLMTTNRLLVYNFQIVDGQLTNVTSFPAPTATCCQNDDMAWDGTNLWFADRFRVVRLSPSGQVLASFPVADELTGIDWDGAQLWIAQRDRLKRVSTSGEVQASHTTDLPWIKGLTRADGTLVAIGGSAPSSNGVYRFNP